ncbi:MAG TPA: hypothetical protein VEK31_07415 [Xanthobacteraceae bacterium]|nr:hypothetical protein [Xanthobacteraceae bacterium]
MTDTHRERNWDRVVEQLEFNTLFAVTFVVLLIGASLALLLPWTWPRRVLSNKGRWFVRQAWEDAGLFTGFAFMG